MGEEIIINMGSCSMVTLVVVFGEAWHQWLGCAICEARRVRVMLHL